MKQIYTKKNKHLTLEDRIEISSILANNFNFRQIATALSKDPSTISKEVRKHRRSRSNDNLTQSSSCPLLIKPPYLCN